MANAFSQVPSRVKFYFHILKDDDHENKKRKKKEKRKRTSVYTADKFQLPTRMLALLHCAHTLILQRIAYSRQQTCAKIEIKHLFSAFKWCIFHFSYHFLKAESTKL